MRATVLCRISEVGFGQSEWKQMGRLLFLIREVDSPGTHWTKVSVLHETVVFFSRYRFSSS